MNRKINCMFHVPHELSGIGDVCALMHSACNGLGRRCIAYQRETAESRKALEDAIAARRKTEKKGEAK